MGKIDALGRWIRWGNQKRAVAQALEQPLTSSQICVAAKKRAPRIQLRDVCQLLRDFERQGLAACLTPTLHKGKLYSLTPLGHRIIQSTFAKISKPMPDLHWESYAFVRRARVRRIVTQELGSRDVLAGATAGTIRKRLRQHRTLTFAAIWEALKELETLKLVESTIRTKKRGSKIYRLTAEGEKIRQYLTFSEQNAENPF